MLVTCVGCNTTATLDAPAASVCAKCGAPQRLAGRFVALQRSGVVRIVDVFNEAAVEVLRG